MAWWGRHDRRAAWRNPYFQDQRRARLPFLLGGSLVGVALVVAACVVLFRSFAIREMHVEGSTTMSQEARAEFTQAIERGLGEGKCLLLLSCRSWAFLSTERVESWVKSVPVPIQAMSVSYADGILQVHIEERPSSYAIAVGDDVWLLDDEGKPLRLLTTVERVRRAVESPSDQGVPWADARSTMALSDAQNDWPVLVRIWTWSRVLPCVPTTLAIESSDLVRLRTLCDDRPLDLLLTLRQDSEEQMGNLQRFFDERVVDWRGIGYIDARYHQRLFYK